MMWLVCALSGGGAGVIASCFMEAYFQRRAQDEVGMFDKGLE